MRSVPALLLAALTLAAAGCGGSDNASDSTPVPTTTLPEQTATTTTPTVTTPTVTTTTPTTTATTPTTTATTPTTTQPTGGASADDANTGGAPVDDTPKQDPDCKPGTGPGFPDKPQCEPVAGPDAIDEG